MTRLKLLDTLQQKIGFTRNEAGVVLFLSSTFLAGLAFRWYGSNSHPSPPPGVKFDYSRSDSIFTERSKRIHTIDSLSRSLQGTAGGKKSSSLLQPNSIDINTAVKDQLMLLPGIGEEYAERIILYREDNGPFSSVNDLDNVKGIGKKRLEKLRPYVTVK